MASCKEGYALCPLSCPCPAMEPGLVVLSCVVCSDRATTELQLFKMANVNGFTVNGYLMLTTQTEHLNNYCESAAFVREHTTISYCNYLVPALKY